MDNNTNAVVPANVATALTSHRLAQSVPAPSLYAPSANHLVLHLASGPRVFGAGVRAMGQVSAQVGRTVPAIDATAFMKVWAPPPRRDPL